MAKQQLMADLNRALTQSNQFVATLRLHSERAAATKDVVSMLRSATALDASIPILDAAIKAFDAHARTWDNESKWKRAKNLAVPKLTATRTRMKQTSADAKQSKGDFEKLVKRSRLIAARLKLS